MADEKVYTGIPPSERQYSGVPILGGLEAAYSYLAPVEYPVIEDPRTVYTEDMGRRYTSTTPGVYGEPRPAVPAAIQGGIDFFKQLIDQPGETASAVAEGIAGIPKEQMLGAQALMEGADYAYDPETNEEYRFDPFLVAAPVAGGTAISIARTAGNTGKVLGIMAGRNAHDGDRKFQQFTEAKGKGLDDRAVYAETKGYIEPSDNAFRFEIDTSNAKLNKDYFKDSGMEDIADGAPYQQFQFEEFTKKEGRPPTLGDLMEFKELYYQYPELSDIEIKRVPFGMFTTKAAYDPIDNVIYISSAGPRQMVSNLLHEVQHAVQYEEGHVTGSGVRQYLPEGFEERRKIQSDQVNRSAAFYAEKLGKQAKKKGIDPNLYKYNMARKAKLYFDGDSNAYGYEDLSRYATGADLQDLRLLADDFEKLEAMDAEVIKAGKMYFRQPGEVEARTAQTKYLEDRQGEFPLDVQDVAPEDYFYRIDSKPGVAESSSVNVDTFISGLGGETPFPAQPNRILFPDLKFSDITLRESNIEPGAVDIELLRAGKKGEGLGSQALKRITDHADETGTTLTLYPEPYGDGGLDKDDLISFYQRNGFEFKYPDPDNPDPILDMVRYPRPTVKKAEGGVISLVDVARNMNRGPRGVAALAPIARNMNRPMVS